SLERLGPAAAKAVKPLRAALGNVDGGLQADPVTLMRALRAIGPEAAPALLVGMQPGAVRPEDEVYMLEAARTLVAMAPKDAATVQALGNHLRSTREMDVLHQGLRALDAEALGRIGPDAAAALPALKFALKEDDVLLRARAAEALGRIGPAARD